MRLRVSIAGDGPPLLLINGLGGNLETWEPLRSLLTGRQTIAFDAPGAGASDSRVMPLRMPGLADLVNELLDTLGYGVVDVLGYSLGGVVAQQFAHRHPERVRRLVLAATLPGVGSFQNPVTLMDVVTLPLRKRDAPRRRKAVGRVVGGQAARDPAALEAVESAQRAHPSSRVGIAHQLVAIAGWSSLPWLHTIGVPTLVLFGERDALVPAINNRLFMTLMPDCRAHIVPAAGHLFLIDQPEDVIDVIEAFLAAVETSSARPQTGSARRTSMRRKSRRRLRGGTSNWKQRGQPAIRSLRARVKRRASRFAARALMSERRPRSHAEATNQASAIRPP
jgi:pimeloyl-ACP methyl ester carboxylesterase